MNQIVPRATVEQVVANRNRALDLYGEALASITTAARAFRAAHDAAALVSPGRNGFTNAHHDEIKAFYASVRLPDPEQFMRVARKVIDIEAWAWIIERTELERLMDKEAKDELRAQMAYVPEKVDHRGQLITGEEVAKGLPPVTVENVVATLDRFRGDADMIFRRGIATAFSKLDRRFRSHDGFKIGGRIILLRAFNDSGSWAYYGRGNDRETLMDIERVFAILDGKTVGETYATAIGAIDASRSGYRAQQSVAETDYFRIRVFQNGNAHLWMKRDDLVAQVNKLLAEYYGEVIGDGQTKEADPFEDVKRAPARYFGFFPTPPAAADRLLDRFPLIPKAEEPQLRILEPSAGTGNLARRCVKTISQLDSWSGGREESRHKYRFDNLVDCIEVQPHLADGLRAEGIYNRVLCGDFLSYEPGRGISYDRIVMNPPFDRERDIDHVMHAMKFLKPDGILTAIMSAGTEFRETRKATAFRERMQKLNARWSDLPEGSFSEVGTYVNTVTLTVRADGRATYR